MMTRVLRVAALTLLMLIARGGALAQKTGVLLHPADPKRWESLLGASNSEAARATQDTIFAVLMFDPSLSALARSSSWTASVVPLGSSKEARVQANVCDIAVWFCRKQDASSLMFAGPLNSGDDFTELANLDGLVGSARAQLSYTTSATAVGAAYSVTATFSEPSFAYRDSLTLGRRSVDHAAYAIEVGDGYRWSSAALHAAVRWEQSYRAQTAQNVCTPASFGPVGTTTCSSIVLGAPSSAVKTVASVSGAWSIGGNGAVRLTLSHDLQHGVTGIDMPVWVVRNAAGGLAGGVRFGYRTDARQLTASLFVSEFKL
jgi:hypothetical protein